MPALLFARCFSSCNTSRVRFEQLLQTVGKVRRQINPKLLIDGILLTMVDSRTNFAREISALLRETYGALTIRLNASVSTTSEMARSFSATLEPSE